jgi:hypothetical protein
LRLFFDLRAVKSEGSKIEVFKSTDGGANWVNSGLSALTLMHYENGMWVNRVGVKALRGSKQFKDS